MSKYASFACLVAWTTTVRHPAKFSLSKILKSPRGMDRTIAPEFLLDMVLGANPAKQRVRNSAFCESVPLRRSALPSAAAYVSPLLPPSPGTILHVPRVYV